MDVGDLKGSNAKTRTEKLCWQCLDIIKFYKDRLKPVFQLVSPAQDHSTPTTPERQIKVTFATYSIYILISYIFIYLFISMGKVVFDKGSIRSPNVLEQTRSTEPCPTTRSPF